MHRTPRPASPRTVLPLLLALALAFAVRPLSGQETAPAGFTVSGVVRDASTGAGLAGALVELPTRRLRAVTGEDGRFVLQGVPDGEQRWTIRRIGYAAWEESTAVQDGEELVIGLLPSPVALEAIEVQADRLKRRRETSGMSVQVLDQAAILASAAPTTAELVRYHAVRFPTVCAPTPGSGAAAVSTGELCVMTRDARPARVSLCIDEVKSSVELLSAYPPQDIYAIESYEGGRVVRVYTRWFMEKKRSLYPLKYGCT